MTAILLPSGKLRYHATINGVYGPAVGYKLYTYEAGTTTPKATYADAGATTPLSNPIVLDSLGECAPYGIGSYKLVLTDPAGAQIWSQDDVALADSAADEEWCGTAGGTANALTLSPTVGISAYSAGQRFSFIAAGANSGAVTVNVSGAGSVALTKNGNTALAANDLQTGKVYQIQYDGTRFQLSNDPRATLTVTAPATSDDSDRVVTSAWVKDLIASDTQAGIVELATDAEAKAGTDTARAITPANLKAAQIQRSASTATTSGKFNDVTGIPAWAKRVTVVFNDVSTSGTDYMLIQLGDSGGIETSGYVSNASAGAAVVQATNGFLATANTAGTSSIFTGSITFHNATGNTWICSGVVGSNGAYISTTNVGSKTLSGTLDRIRLTTFVGSDDFDAGAITVFYE